MHFDVWLLLYDTKKQDAMFCCLLFVGLRDIMGASLQHTTLLQEVSQ